MKYIKPYNESYISDELDVLNEIFFYLKSISLNVEIKNIKKEDSIYFKILNQKYIGFHNSYRYKSINKEHKKIDELDYIFAVSIKHELFKVNSYKRKFHWSDIKDSVVDSINYMCKMNSYNYILEPVYNDSSMEHNLETIKKSSTYDQFCIFFYK